MLVFITLSLLYILFFVLAIKPLKKTLFFYPGVVLLIWFSLDAVIAPISTTQMGIEYYFDMTFANRTRIPFQDFDYRIKAQFALFLYYYTMLLWFNFLKKRKLNYKMNKPDFNFDVFTTSRIRLILGIGVFAVLVSTFIMIRAASISQIAATRAIFTNEAIYNNPIFSYAFLFTNFIPIGVLLLMAKKEITFNWRTILFIVIFLGFLMLLGGRTRVITFLLTLLAFSHLFVKKLRINQIVVPVMMTVIALSGTVLLRFGGGAGGDVMSSAIGDKMLYERRLQQTAMAIRDFPAEYDFFRGSTIGVGLTHIAPGIDAYVGENLYKSMMTKTSTGHVDTGRGGSNYANAAEGYMNFGYLGILFLASLYALNFGLVFRFCQSHSEMSVVKILYIMALTIFFNGMDSKASYNIGALFGEVVLLMSIATLFLYFSRKLAKRLLTMAFFALMAVAFLGLKYLGLNLWVLEVACIIMVYVYFFSTIVKISGKSRLKLRLHQITR